MPPLQEAVIFCTLLYSTVVQHEVLANEDLMELEAQRKDKETQEEEVTEELMRFMTQEMARGFSLLEEALLVFEPQDQNIERHTKLAETVECNPVLLCHLK